MIFASDLDRTLIFSERAIEELGDTEKASLINVENTDGKWCSYMTEASFSALKELCREHLFIPVTTRTTAQFKRIFIFEKEIPLSYAITTNGAYIYFNGEPLVEWSEIISSRIRMETSFKEDLLSYCRSEGILINGKLKQVEDLFFYYILESLPLAEEMKIIIDKASSLGWRVSLQGRKLYFIPKAINKGDALEFICQKEGMEAIAGAGDSILDWDFLKGCRHRFVPNHGELVKEMNITGCSITSNSGILAGEEILQQYLTLLSTII